MPGTARKRRALPELMIEGQGRGSAKDDVMLSRQLTLSGDRALPARSLLHLAEGIQDGGLPTALIVALSHVIAYNLCVSGKFHQPWSPQTPAMQESF